MEFFGITDTGKVRKDNQDSFISERVAGDRIITAIVCDGMGGEKAGATASKLASQRFFHVISTALEDESQEGEISDLLCQAVFEANTCVYEKSIEDESCSGMGTTIVAALCKESGETVVVNVGDSRAYLVSEKGIKRITRDHSLVQRMVSRGELTPEEARSHPKKNLITRALGVDKKVLSDVFTTRIEKGSTLLLCTDGLSNMIRDEELERTVKRHSDLESLCKELVELSYDRGAPDNVTAVVVRK